MMPLGQGRQTVARRILMAADVAAVLDETDGEGGQRAGADHPQLAPGGQEVASNWNQIPARFSNVVLDTFVVMPDHMHAILLMTDRGAQDAAPLPAILDFFQSSSSQSVDCGIWRGNGRKHVIRDRDELDRIRRYIRLNPQRWPRQPADLASFGRD